jgi:hypothetical protein
VQLSSPHTQGSFICAYDVAATAAEVVASVPTEQRLLDADFLQKQQHSNCNDLPTVSLAPLLPQDATAAKHPRMPCPCSPGEDDAFTCVIQQTPPTASSEQHLSAQEAATQATNAAFEKALQAQMCLPEDPCVQLAVELLAAASYALKGDTKLAEKYTRALKVLLLIDTAQIMTTTQPLVKYRFLYFASDPIYYEFTSRSAKRGILGCC